MSFQWSYDYYSLIDKFASNSEKIICENKFWKLI